MNTEQPTQFWMEFIDMLRENPCLWNSKSEDFNNQTLKTIALGLLTEKLWEIDVDADTETVKRKLQSFKVKFGKEASKVRKLNDGAQKFESGWCYYEPLKFLAQSKNNDTENTTPVKPMDRNSAQYNVEVTSSESFRNSSGSLLVQRDYIRKDKVLQEDRGRKSKESTPAYDTPPVAAHIEKKRKLSCHSEGGEDDCSTLAAHINVRLRSLDPMQKCIAQKLISDVMFLAETKQLELSSSISISNKK